jgi:aspartate aminotransferase-like enzyme
MRAMMVAMEDHRSSKFPELTMLLFHELKKVFKTEIGQPFIFSGSGTGAWGAALTNTLSPGDKVLAPRFGQFSFNSFSKVGGLMAYGPNLPSMFKRAAGSYRATEPFRADHRS